MAWNRVGLIVFLAVFFVLTACGQVDDKATAEISEKAETVIVEATATVLATDTPTKAVPTAVSPITISPTDTPLPTLTPLPTNTAVPPSTTTPIASVTPEPTATATASAVPITVNGVPVENFIKMSPAVVANTQDIFATGQALGRDPHVFSKVGDSVTLTDHYLTRFDSGYYNLGEYAYLQPAIDHYAGSFERYGVAARIGLHAWSLFDPLWANKEWCQPNEDMIACEIRLNNPSVLIIRLGSNDSAGGAYFEDNLRLLVEYAIEQGIIPVLATKPDRFEGPDNRNNLAILKLAHEYDLPLWDFDVLAESIPNKGLGGDQVHMTMADADDYTNPDFFERGYPMSDLTALMMLHAIYSEVVQAHDA